MINREEITSKLSILVEKRLDSNKSYWSSEVNFDLGKKENKRIDFVGFKAKSGYEPISAELGKFTCYEVKSCMADFESGHGLSFYGDENYLVCTPELAAKLGSQLRIPHEINAILCPDKSWSRLYKKYDFGSNVDSYRRRPSLEMLWAIVQSH